MKTIRRLSFFLVFLGLPGCDGKPKDSIPATTPEKSKKEADLAYATLSPKAALSLKIQTQAARREEVQDYLPLPGWIMAAPGHEAAITAPAAGYVRLVAPGGHVPAVGEAVVVDQVLFRFEPVLSPGEQIQMAALKRGIESDLAKAKISLKAAQSEWQTMKDLVDQNLRGKQELIQAQKILDHAKEELAAATDKQKLFDQPTHAIRATRSGTVSAVHVTPGQYVTAASPLVTLIDLNPVWVRVPVPEFELALVEGEKPAPVKIKGPGGEIEVKARPVGRSPMVDSGKHSVEFHYQLADQPPGVGWAKDQMVKVLVPLSLRRRESIVPASAIVYDIHGSGWIYLDRTPPKAEEHRYQRRRVEIGPSLNNGIVIRPGLAANDLVVIHGAAALFSREFHFPPIQQAQAVEDDD